MEKSDQKVSLLATLRRLNRLKFSECLSGISVVVLLQNNALAAPNCFSDVSVLKSNFAKSPRLAMLKPLVDSTNFVGSVPVPVFGSTPADATIVYGTDKIVLSLHVEDPRPLYSDFRILKRPVSICVDGEQFYFQDAANGGRFLFTVSGSSLSIHKDNYVLTMQPAGAGGSSQAVKRSQPNKGNQ